MAAQQGGVIQDGAKFSGVGSDFTPFVAISELPNGIDVADVVGTITRPIEVTAQDGNLTFRAENRTTLTSFAGGNLLGTRVVNPTTGKLSTKTQVFTFTLPIPQKFLPKNQSPSSKCLGTC